MVSKGWNQSELARQASLFMPQGKKMGRDNISNYVRGDVLPGPLHLDAIAKALNVAPVDILDTRGGYLEQSIAKGVEKIELATTENGLAYLRIAQEVPMDKAMRIIAILQGED